MRGLSAKHRIYLLCRRSRAEESMISFIRDKLIRKGCSVIQDITQSTMVLVLLTPGVFEFIDDPEDKVRNELLYVLRRSNRYDVLAILCDLFKWPDSVHLPDDVLSLKACDAIEWSPENRNAFMNSLLERIDPSLLDVMSRPTSPNIIYEEDETVGNGGGGRNGVSTPAQNEEEVDSNLRRTGSAFFFDELNAHVERKSEVQAGRKRKPKITEYPALGSPRDQGRLEETSDDTDIEESYDMEAYAPPERPGSVRAPAAGVDDRQAYRPPERPGDAGCSNAESDASEHAIASDEVPFFSGDEPDSYGVSKRGKNRADSYEPPELPMDEQVLADIEGQILRTPSPSGATATIRPRSGDKRLIYVPPPSPPPLEGPHGGRDENDAVGASRTNGGREPRGGTTRVAIHRGDTERASESRNDVMREVQPTVPPVGGLRPEPQRQPKSRGESAWSDDTTIVSRNPHRNRSSAEPSSRIYQTSGTQAEKGSSLGKLLHRRTFKLPRDSEIRYGRYADEHPYWNAGTYRKFNLSDEFCDESYFANKRNTLPRTSIRLPRRNSSRLAYSEPVKSDVVRSKRAPSVVVVEETQVRRFVPEIEPPSDEPSEDAAARTRDAGSTPKSERKVYEPPEKYHPSETESIRERAIVTNAHEEAAGVETTPERYEPPAKPQIIKEPLVTTWSRPPPGDEEYRPPAEPDLTREPRAREGTTSSQETLKNSALEEPPEIPKSCPPAYEVEAQIVPKFVVLPPPRKHIMVNHARIEDNASLQEFDSPPDQPTYTQQLSRLRRLPSLVSPDEIKTTVPDVRTAARWTQVEMDVSNRRAQPLKELDGGSEYEPPPIPEFEVGDEHLPSRGASSPLAETFSAENTETVGIAPAVIRRYKTPEPPVENALKSEPIAYREPVIDAERKPEPLVRREAPPDARPRAKPRAQHESGVDTKSEPIAHREVGTRAEEIPRPGPRAERNLRSPDHAAVPHAGDSGELIVTRGNKPIAFKTRDEPQRFTEPELEPMAVTRRVDPRSLAATNGIPDAASFSKQNIITDRSAQTSVDTSSGASVSETNRLGRPIIVQREDSGPFTPPNSFTETEPSIDESIRRALPPIYRELPMQRDTALRRRSPAIPIEFSQSQFSPDDAYQPPPMPYSARVEDDTRGGDVQRTGEPVAYRILPSQARAPSPASGTTYRYPPPLEFNDRVEDNDKQQSSGAERKTQPASYEQAPWPRRDPTPVYVPPRLPVGGVDIDDREGSPAAFPRPAAPAHNTGTDDDGETGRVAASDELRNTVEEFRAPRVGNSPTGNVPSQRRSRSVIEVSRSTMEPALRRRVNSLDPRLSRDLREYVERHACDRNCCKVVCPRRLAENLDNLHYADDVRILTNLDVLSRRRLSYLLAIEAQRYVSFLDSKFITAARNDEGSKTPDSGCDPSSKVSEGDSDATSSDVEFVCEEAVARELAKIEKIRRRNAQSPENGLVPPPREFGGADRYQVYTSSERKKNKMDETRAPPGPTGDVDRSRSGSARSGRARQAQDRRPELPSGYESPNGILSNPAAREAMKNIIEGRTVFESHNRKALSHDGQRDSDAKEAYNTWHKIWKDAKREEVPALSGDEILSLFGVMRHILGTKSTSLQEVRNDLRTIIRKNGMGLRR